MKKDPTNDNPDNHELHHQRGPRDPLHEGITEAMIEKLVHHFYDKIRADQELGPIFNNTIKDNWPVHLERMCLFWGSVALKTGGYKGRPVPKHVALEGVTPDHFKIWLSLFRQSAIEVCGHDIGLHFIDRAEKIAESLQLAMFFQNSIAFKDTFINGELSAKIPEKGTKNQTSNLKQTNSA